METQHSWISTARRLGVPAPHDDVSHHSAGDWLLHVIMIIVASTLFGHDVNMRDIYYGI